jgi:hypothetical protein
MNPEQPKNQVEKGSKIETEAHRDGVSRFLQNYLSTPHEQRQRYDVMTELHFSGLNTTVMRKIADGTAQINSVDVWYEKGKPDQIHAVFDSGGEGHNIDVYLKAAALFDYLGEKK